MNRLHQFLLNQFSQGSKRVDSEILYFVSFPKSGRTWIELMTAHAASALSGLDIREFLGKHPHTYSHQLSGQPLPYIAFSHGKDNFEICKAEGFPSEFYRDRRIVLLVRDPRDTIISNYYYQKWHHQLFDGTLTEFIHFPYQTATDKGSRYGIAPIINYMNAWIENRALFKQIHIIQYEQMKKDTPSTLASYLAYVGFPMSQELLDEVIVYGHFDNMRKLEMSNELDWYGLGGADSDKGLKTRKGKSGSYHDEFTPDDLVFVNEYIQQHLNPYYDDYRNA